MKRGMLLLLLLLVSLSSSLVLAGNCYVVTNNTQILITALYGSLDADCNTLACSATNPFLPVMYDSGSCALLTYENCECEPSGPKPECASKLTTTIYNTNLLKNDTIDLPRSGLCFPSCGSCGSFTEQDPETCLSDDGVSDSNCFKCECDATKSPQCNKTVDLTGNPGTCKKCSATGDVVYEAVGTPCQTATTSGFCDSNAICVSSLLNCTQRPNGKICEQGKSCLGDIIYTPDTPRCCIGSCVDAISNCTQEGGKTCPAGKICLGNVIPALDNPTCCMGECQLRNCSASNGKTCPAGRVCAVPVTPTIDNPNCCIGQCRALARNCTNLGGTPCDKEKQECEGEEISSSDEELCCLACKDKSKNWDEIMKWLLIIIVAFVAISFLSCKGGGILKKLGGGLGGGLGGL